MPRVTVWYDGGCPLCRREMVLIRNLDRAGAIRFVDVADPETASCPLDRETMLARFHAEEDGALYSGIEAFAAMWRAIPLLRPFGLMARSPTVIRLLDHLYTYFLGIRPALHRLLPR